jgi:SAM-dependent methyltransferase
VASPFVRRLAGYAPPAVRRAIAGALTDLKSLPARLADPARRAEPWAFAHNVGDGDFQAVGAQLLRNLKDHAALRPTDRVLDIGCGNGRVAAQLAPFLRDGGGYVGFDISKAGVAACRRRFTSSPHLRFEHLDVWNGEYNATGKVREEETVFPVADASVDLAFATSVFTHMRMPAVRRYLAEAARVLKPGGRFAFTAFALEPRRDRSEVFDFQPFDATSKVIDQRYPERAIGHDRTMLEAAVAEAGLSLQGSWKGAWSPPADYDGGQDLFVAVRPSRRPRRAAASGSRRRG